MDALGNRRPLMEISHLTVGFEMYEPGAFWRAKKKRTPVIEDLCLSIYPGEVLAVLGASGAGKSLLAESILGLYEPNSFVTGHVSFDGETQSALSLARLRGHEIAYVPQSIDALDPRMRVGQAIGGEPARRRALMQRYNLGPEVERMYPTQLSGGMARRVLLVMALMGSPALLIADEPTPGLDQALSQQVVGDLRDLADQGMAVLLITHDLPAARACADRVAIFDQGRIATTFGVGKLETWQQAMMEV